jgi:hypothetical protein
MTPETVVDRAAATAISNPVVTLSRSVTAAPTPGRSRVDDVLEIGFERGAQLQRFGSGLGRGQLRRRLRLLLLQRGPFGFESFLDLFGLLIGGVEFGFAGFDVLDPGLRLFEFGPAFGDAGLDRLDLRAIVLDAGLEVGDPLGGLRLLRDQCRTVSSPPR